jgi:hypothetical protein
MVSFLRHIITFTCLIIVQVLPAQNVPWIAPSVSLISSPIVIDCIPQVNGLALTEGDYIGIFNDEDRCYGLGRWKDTVVFRITVYGSDGITDGFETGENINLKLWLKNEDCILENVAQIDSDSPLIFTNSTSNRIYVLNFERASVSFAFEEYCLNEAVIQPQQNYDVKDLRFLSSPGLSLDAASGYIDPSRSSPGSYTITLNSKFCLTRRNLSLTLNEFPQIEYMPDTFICGDKLAIMVEAQDQQILWSSGSTSQQIELTEPGNIWYKLSNNKGCSNSDTFNVQKMAIARIDFGVEKADCYKKGRLRINDQEITNGKPPYSYILTNQIDQTEITDLSNVPEGIYNIDVVNSNGCSLRHDEKIIIEKDCLNDIPVFSPNDDGLDDTYFINLEGRIEIFDRNGQLKRKLTGPCYFDGKDSNDHSLPMGVYMVVSEQGNSVVLTIIR